MTILEQGLQRNWVKYDLNDEAFRQMWYVCNMKQQQKKLLKQLCPAQLRCISQGEASTLVLVPAPPLVARPQNGDARGAGTGLICFGCNAPEVDILFRRRETLWCWLTHGICCWLKDDFLTWASPDACPSSRRCWCSARHRPTSSSAPWWQSEPSICKNWGGNSFQFWFIPCSLHLTHCCWTSVVPILCCFLKHRIFR